MPGSPGPHGGEGQSLTMELLASRAAAAALSGPEVRPGQWAYRNYAVVAAPSNASSPVIEALGYCRQHHCRGLPRRPAGGWPLDVAS
jgi:hypothetical protein